MKIAIYGPMCSGKSTVANIIKEYDSRYDIYSFGKKIISSFSPSTFKYTTF